MADSPVPPARNRPTFARFGVRLPAGTLLAGRHLLPGVCTLVLATVLLHPATAQTSAQFGSPGSDGLLPLEHHYVTVDVAPPWVFANQGALVHVDVLRTDGHGAPNATVQLVAHAPSGSSETVALTQAGPDAADGPGQGTPFSGSYTFPSAGQWTVDVQVTDGNQTDIGSGTIRVYPVLSLAVVARSPLQAQQGESRLLHFGVVHVQGQPDAPPVTDLTARVEHKPSSVAAPDRTWTVPLNASATAGDWLLDANFAQDGTYRYRFNSHSGAFGYDDMPPIDVRVQERPPTPTVQPAPSASLPAVSATSLSPAAVSSHGSPAVSAFPLAGALVAAVLVHSGVRPSRPGRP